LTYWRSFGPSGKLATEQPIFGLHTLVDSPPHLRPELDFVLILVHAPFVSSSNTNCPYLKDNILIKRFFLLV